MENCRESAANFRYNVTLYTFLNFGLRSLICIDRIIKVNKISINVFDHP